MGFLAHIKQTPFLLRERLSRTSGGNPIRKLCYGTQDQNRYEVGTAFKRSRRTGDTRGVVLLNRGDETFYVLEVSAVAFRFHNYSKKKSSICAPAIEGTLRSRTLL